MGQAREAMGLHEGWRPPSRALTVTYSPPSHTRLRDGNCLTYIGTEGSDVCLSVPQPWHDPCERLTFDHCRSAYPGPKRPAAIQVRAIPSPVLEVGQLPQAARTKSKKRFAWTRPSIAGQTEPQTPATAPSPRPRGKTDNACSGSGGPYKGASHVSTSLHT